MKSISLGAPQSTRSLSSFLVRVGRSTMTPGRLTFLRSLHFKAPSQLVSSQRCMFSCSALSGERTAACKRARQEMKMHRGTATPPRVPALTDAHPGALQERAAESMPGICSLQPQVHVQQGSLFQWAA